MRFSIYRPDTQEKVPVLYWLSGLTCTEENFTQKSGVQRYLSEHKIACVAMDTSPRNLGIAGETENYKLGAGAGFYVNAVQEPWAKHYKMYDYVAYELNELIAKEFSVDTKRQGIFGHSMGGHGALVLGLRNQDRFRSISAFAPICSSMNSPLGNIAFPAYLGDDKNTWKDYDACQLISKTKTNVPLLVDQGDLDEFYISKSLRPDLLLEACRSRDFPLTYNLRLGYDHSYYFVASFIESHIEFHAKHLTSK
jgi:S-formylglutathione hydrolase